MAGIYIHIPFCKKACTYCNFHFVTSLRQKEELITAIVNEISLRERYLDAENIETIYFGGGTPSLLSKDELLTLLQKIHSTFKVAETEITLEANPDDITEEKLKEWKDSGVNRISIGIQSFFDEDLRWMNRAHNAEEAIRSLQLAIEQFDNITVDLIYGTPGLSNEKWKSNVERMINAGIPHLSCYALTVEPKTPLDKLIREQRTSNVDPDKQSEQFLLLMNWMEEAGYEHYEISNFAKPGHRSKHNSSYWSGKKYIGLGPSAHSYNGSERQWNISNNAIYIDSIGKGNLPAEKEVLTPVQQLNEYIMTSLRTVEGADLELLQTKFGVSETEMVKKAEKFLHGQLVIKSGTNLKLSKEGKLLADGIAADLFF